MNTTLFFVRSGETEWDIEQRMQGRKDSLLTSVGIEQAKTLAQRLEHIHFHAIYSSESKRACDTASYILHNRKIKLKRTTDLMEMSFGDWEGRTLSDIQLNYPDEYHLFWKKPNEYEAKESKGETFIDVQERVIPFVQIIVERHVGETILLVTDTCVIKTLFNFYSGSDLSTLWDSPNYDSTSSFILEFTPNEVHLSFEGERLG
ncbi:histidine phosphatase family protein [Shimazuella sp. AN120528]|uniref:histidine phosphatase family protein n=1 Tax=Shimazuella soli TaxID=1892854 RepID=UPI001F0D1A12|nr:histidine phosphatase family protein [Shimazuella soli]MCH5585610.1 histidine phosphatase family protein [Shimazuella soli]